MNGKPTTYIVNTSFFVPHDAYDRWVAFIQAEYLPLLEVEGFTSRFFRVLDRAASPEGCTYCLMTECADTGQYRNLVGPLFDKYTAAAMPLFGDSVQCFTSLLKEIKI